MKQSNTIFKQVASNLNDFVKNIAKGKVVQKFLIEFFSGMLACRTLLLSEIARANNKDVLITKQVERLGNQLESLPYKDIILNYHKAIKHEINSKTIYCIDNSDVIKPYGKEFEFLCTVRDGSTGELEKGYEIMNIVALTQNHKQPIPIYSMPFSYVDKNYTSNNDETERGLDLIRQSFGPGGIKVFDRAYDDCKLMRYLSGHKEKFIIRTKEKRNVVYQGNSIPITDLISQKDTGKSSWFKRRNNNYFLTYKSYPIKIDDISLNFVVVSGFPKPIYFYTNLELDKDLEMIVLKIYSLRWKAEQKFGFEKQYFDMENFRVRSLKAIRAIILLTSMLCGFIAMLCEYQQHKLFKNLFRISQSIPKKERKNRLFMYSIARALSVLFIIYFSSD